jgi:hypothetical protein
MWTAVQIDRSHGAATAEERAEADALVSFLTPVLKAYGTDRAFETAVDMQQLFGGHGYIKEWGMEQIVRDARIGMIYEGANGVQAMDLAGRKLAKDGGKVAIRFAAMVAADLADAPAWIAAPMEAALTDTQAAAQALLQGAVSDPNHLGAGAYAFMQLIGVLLVGWMWARMATIAADREDDFARAKIITARHYAQFALPLTATLRRRVGAGSANLMAMPEAAFVR